MMPSEQLRVGVRLRPLVAHERHQQSCLAIHDNDALSLVPHALPEGDCKEGPWRFDHAFDSSDMSSPNCIDNAKAYDIIGRRIVQHALEGFNACLFCYGQTGTGKTTTILGDKRVGPGLLHYLFKDLFEQKYQEERQGNSVTIAVQMLEVYNEKVFDLLRAEQDSCAFRTNVELHVLPTGVRIKGAELITVESVEQCLSLIEMGNKYKHMAATAVNPHSSRGHTVFKLVIQRNNVEDGIHLHSEVYFADLAGHENEKTTKVTGERLVELSYINKSLMWLQSAIHALACASKGRKTHADLDGHRMALFRNSKLTLLLSNALLGNSLVHVIVTLSPAAEHFSTSLSSLRFANEVKHIMVDAHSSAHVDPSLQNKKLEAEVKHLKEQLALCMSNGQLPAAQKTLQEQFDLAAVDGVQTDPAAFRGIPGSIAAGDATSGQSFAAAQRALEDKLQASQAENDQLRCEMEMIRMDLRESRACVRGLHADLDDAHKRQQWLSDALGQRHQGGGDSEYMVIGPEVLKLMVAISGKVNELFRDMEVLDQRKAKFTFEGKQHDGVRTEALLAASTAFSDSTPSPSGRRLSATERSSSRRRAQATERSHPATERSRKKRAESPEDSPRKASSPAVQPTPSYMPSCISPATRRATFPLPNIHAMQIPGTHTPPLLTSQQWRVLQAGPPRSTAFQAGPPRGRSAQRVVRPIVAVGTIRNHSREGSVPGSPGTVTRVQLLPQQPTSGTVTPIVGALPTASGMTTPRRDGMQSISRAVTPRAVTPIRGAAEYTT